LDCEKLRQQQRAKRGESTSGNKRQSEDEELLTVLCAGNSNCAGTSAVVFHERFLTRNITGMPLGGAQQHIM
jgi:hypothetical protein